MAKIGRELNILWKIKLDTFSGIPLIKQDSMTEVDNFWQNYFNIKGKHYKENFEYYFPIFPWFNKISYIDRQHTTTLLRIRTGHFWNGSHLFKFGIKDSPLCECGNLEDINHIFLDCNVLSNNNIYWNLVKLGSPTSLSMETAINLKNIRVVRYILAFLQYNVIKL